MQESGSASVEELIQVVPDALHLFDVFSVIYFPSIFLFETGSHKVQATLQLTMYVCGDGLEPLIFLLPPLSYLTMTTFQGLIYLAVCYLLSPMNCKLH